MVEADDLHLIIGSADIDGLRVAHLEELLGHAQTATNVNVCPIRVVQVVPNRKGIDIDDADDLQLPLFGLLGAIEGVLDCPLSQLRRIENRFAPGHHSGQGLTALGHGDLGAIVGNHMNLGRRTLLAESVQSVIHRGVGLAQFQCGLRSVFQQRFLGQCGADHITPSGVQRNVHGGGTSQKLTAPLVKGFRHCGRSL